MGIETGINGTVFLSHTYIYTTLVSNGHTRVFVFCNEQIRAGGYPEEALAQTHACRKEPPARRRRSVIDGDGDGDGDVRRPGRHDTRDRPHEC